MLELKKRILMETEAPLEITETVRARMLTLSQLFPIIPHSAVHTGVRTCAVAPTRATGGKVSEEEEGAAKKTAFCSQPPPAWC